MNLEFLSLINVGLISVSNLPKLPKLKKVSAFSLTVEERTILRKGKIYDSICKEAFSIAESIWPLELGSLGLNSSSNVSLMGKSSSGYLISLRLSFLICKLVIPPDLAELL